LEKKSLRKVLFCGCDGNHDLAGAGGFFDMPSGL
jgi:hypothetical protein